jgi:hypothetical protein
LFATKLRTYRVSSLPPWTRCFQRNCAVLLDRRFPPLSSAGSSSPALCLLFKVLADSHPPEALSNLEQLPWGLFPHRDLSSQSLPLGELPRSPSFRPQRFSRSRRLPPLSTLRACFIPLPRPGFTPQGISPLPSRATRRRAVPSCRLPTFASSRVAPTVQLRPARLQGFDPGSDPLRPAECLVLPTARSPLEFSLLRAFFRSPWRRLRASSAPALGRQNLHVTPVTGLQRIDG